MRSYKRRGRTNTVLLILCLFLIAVIVVGTTFYIIENLPAADEKNTENSLKDAKTVQKVEKKKQVVVHFVNNNDFSALGITEEQNELIKSYFTKYFGSLGDFSNKLVNDLFADYAIREANITNMMVSYQNSIRSHSSVDMKYDEITCGVTYKSIVNDAGNIIISLVQNDYESFAFAKDQTSYTCDVEHTFVMNLYNGSFKLVSHSEISSVYDLISGFFANDASSEQIEASYKSLVEQTKTKMNELKNARDVYNSDPVSFMVTKTAAIPYNSKAALDYAYTWTGKTELIRNPEYESYDTRGGNCCNFVSQCLLNGGIPFDVVDAVWKWYGGEVDNTEQRTGFSESWTNSEAFYKYCTENVVGMVTDIPQNVYCGRPGDIIQYLNSDGVAKHSAIITKVIYDDDGNVLDFLVSCNTTDKVDAPMESYGYNDFRLIRIIGNSN